MSEDDPSTPPPIPAYQPPSPRPAPAADPQLRAEAAKRLEARADFRRHLVVYWIVMTFLVAIWLVTGGVDTYFWPIWPMLGWGLGIALHGVSLRWDNPPTDEQVDAEARRIAARRGQLPAASDPSD